VGRDPSTDLALLHTESNLVAAPHADPQTLEVGHLVLALARDEDGAAGATLGVISSLGGPWRTWRGGDVERLVRPDLNVYPGFSGGPLIDASGGIIGLNTWGLSRRSALTLPVATIARVVAQLETGGRIKHGYLGVALQAVRLPEALKQARALNQDAGAIVVDVAENGPAERAGVTIGDVVLGLGKHRIEGSDDVQHALGGDAVGSTQTLRVLRGGDLRELSVTIAERPQ
jgi:S1-C subfamily serine protease